MQTKVGEPTMKLGIVEWCLEERLWRGRGSSSAPGSYTRHDFRDPSSCVTSPSPGPWGAGRPGASSRGLSDVHASAHVGAGIGAGKPGHVRFVERGGRCFRDGN